MSQEEWGLIPLFNIVGGVMENKIRSLIEEVINEAGYILDEVLYLKENNLNFLRIVIDKDNGYVDVNDCVIVNNLLDPILDKIDFIEDSYIVDICSKEKGSEQNGH